MCHGQNTVFGLGDWAIVIPPSRDSPMNQLMMLMAVAIR